MTAGSARVEARVDGILVVDKPIGPTSHDVVALVRRLAGTRKIGHGGTLDPFASGVLPLYLGLGTRVVEFHLGARKAYRATVVFGGSSTTDDLEGEITPAEGAPPSREAVAFALAAFEGVHEQRPPAFSARKVGGRRAYALARRGETPELKPRTVTFHELVLVRWDDSDPEHPIAVVDVACSAGTYIRALARDLGAAVGAAAYLGALRRTASGPFTLADARPLDEVRAAAAAERLVGLLLPAGAGLEDLPAVALAAAELRVVAHGGWTGRVERLGAAGEGITSGGRSASWPPTAPSPRSPGWRTAAAWSRTRCCSSGKQWPSTARRSVRDALPGIAALRPADGPLLVAVGVFDGLHRGHLYLLRELRRAALRLHARPTVLTFDHHPDEILAGAAPPLLCDPDERLARLERDGVAVTVVEHFDEALRRTSYDAFVASIRARTRLAGFLMTPDAAFGHERRGTPETLARLGLEVGFAVVVVPPFELAGHPVRSSEIRRAIATGDLAGARALLGRRVAVTGFVAERSLDGREALLRFPLPVALPPIGPYRAALSAAWSPGLRPGPARRASVVVDEPGSLLVRADPDALRHDRLRVAFIS